MTAFFLSSGSRLRFERSDLSDGYSEQLIQDLLFDEPDLLPLSQIDPGAGRFIPICRELILPKTGGSARVDVFGVTPHGRPVLVECKLWRNPQARREVIGQVLEYAALLGRWSYADLTARLKAQLEWTGENPLYDHAVRHGSSLSEALFTDSVSRNLRNGDFHLIVAGDGIREDATAIAEHLGTRGARIALVELQRWRDGQGNELIVPFIPIRTEVVVRRLLVDINGLVVRDADDAVADETEIDEVIDPERATAKIENRRFWQAFIDQSHFDHPDQPQPRHGGNNWVKISLPSPARWITAYRYKGRVGFYLVEEEGSGLIEALLADAASLQEDFGADTLRLHALNDPDRPALAVDQPEGVIDQLAWLLDTSNRLVTLLRARLA
jgi:hypothetical protein